MASLRQVTIKQHEDRSISLVVDGEDISQKVYALSLDVSAGDGIIPRLVIEYHCYDSQITIEGEMEVIHNCPRGGRGK